MSGPCLCGHARDEHDGIDCDERCLQCPCSQYEEAERPGELWCEPGGIPSGPDPLAKYAGDAGSRHIGGEESGGPAIMEPDSLGG